MAKLLTREQKLDLTRLDRLVWQIRQRDCLRDSDNTIARLIEMEMIVHRLINLAIE